MNLRRLLFWTHLTAGSIAGVVILIMSFTGVLLAYERQITNWANREYRSVQPQPDAAPLPVGELLAKVCLAQPTVPSSVLVHSRSDLPAEIGFGPDRTVYFDSYTGAPLGVASQRTRNFFRSVENWHRWLGVSNANRATGRLVTGISNLAFLVLVSTGIFLWWPRAWTWQRFKTAVTWRRHHATSRARNWNWHTVTGFWCALPLLVIVSCGVVMSFPWANNLLYRLTGSPVPVQGAPGAQSADASAPQSTASDRPHSQGGPNAGANAKANHPLRDENAAATGREVAQSSNACGINVAAVNALWTRAAQQDPAWHSLTLRVLPNAHVPAVFSIDASDGGHPDKRSQLTLDPQTASVIRWEPFSGQSEGRRLRAWVRFSHTGEAGGVFGETIAALAALGATGLVFTGLTMAWRRLLANFEIGSAGNRESRASAPTQLPVEDFSEYEVLKK